MRATIGAHNNPVPMQVTIKSAEEQARMRVAGKLAAEVLDMIEAHVRPGISTGELDSICHRYITEQQQAVPAPLNYRGFPRSICTSLNQVVCHGIPGKRRLKDGDMLNIDITVIKDGFHGDTSRIFHVGRPRIKAQRLASITFEAMWAGIREIAPGKRLGDVGHAIQTLAEARGLSVVREYCGHGIGRGFHEPPNVLHYGEPGAGMVLREGMAITVEPMLNEGRPETRLLPDGWTVVTRDRKLSAQWEHTVLVTTGGFEVLTLGAGPREP